MRTAADASFTGTAGVGAAPEAGKRAFGSPRSLAPAARKTWRWFAGRATRRANSSLRSECWVFSKSCG